MSSGRVKKSKKNQQYDDEEMPKLTKEETQIARYLRLKCPNRQANLNGIKVDFFIGSKLVDCLMESKWGPGTLQDPPKDAPYSGKLLDSRHACFKYMQRLMQKQLFARAVKVYKESSAEMSDETPSSLRKRKAKEAKEEGKSESTSDKSSPQVEKKEKKKFKLEIYEEDQRFIDENEPYVWYYDPTSTMSSIIGALLILGSIAVCCFPLWPSIVREGVYYLSLAGCGFLGGIIGLAVLKYIFFTLLWVITLGAVEFWIFPNLTEDVGFFESFLPVYTIKYNKKTSKSDLSMTELKNTSTSETVEPAENEMEEESKAVNEPKQVEKDTKNGDQPTHKMQDLTESTVEISTINSGESCENMEKIQEDYDFELVDDDDETNREAEN